ncbi:hypothetical protein Scep_024032 [Stephania cephalantha]|uniref:Uncharacterized protein n=1 Tax=Stephania cephalantha TaxID=152367 RepID=A0AAP0HWS4_9MAGN
MRQWRRSIEARRRCRARGRQAPTRATPQRVDDQAALAATRKPVADGVISRRGARAVNDAMALSDRSRRDFDEFRRRDGVLDDPAQSYDSALQLPALSDPLHKYHQRVDGEASDRICGRDPIECTDRDSDLVMHRDNDMDMFHLDRDFNVPVWACGQPGTAEPRIGGWTARYSRARNRFMLLPRQDVALAYIDWRRQMVCSLRGDLGGAQLVTEEPSLLRRSPACRGGAQPYRVRWGYGLGRVWPWAGMAFGGYGLGSSFIEIFPLRIASISRTKF